MNNLFIKNVLDDKSANELQQTLLSNNFSWYWNEYTIEKNWPLDFSERPNFQFTHLFVADNNVYSNFYNLIFPILQKIEETTNKSIKHIVRIKANLLTQTNLNQNNKFEIHSDAEKGEDCYSFLYYVNNSDGDTVFYSDNENEIQRITPKENSGILFKSELLHMGESPKINRRRIVVNVVIKFE